MRLNQLLERNANGNTSSITIQLLKKLKVRVTAKTATDQVEHHPDYPSLFSISDSLNKWKVENLALQVEPDSLGQLPLPFIAHTKKSGGNFVLVTSVNGTVNYIDERGKIRIANREEFIKNWSGNVLLAEAGKDSGQKDYTSDRKIEILDNLRIPAILVASIGLILLYRLSHQSDPIWGLLLQTIKLTGIMVTGLILLYELDNFNPLLKQICQAGTKVNCKAVLGSKHARLFDLIGWGEIGFFYFSGGFLYSLLAGGTQLMLLSWLNLLALPYVIFSVLYQWRVIRQWCPLCLMVQSLLVLEAILCYFSYWNFYQPTHLSSNDWVPLFTSFLLPVFFWIATKNVYVAALHGKRYRKEASQFKYNKEIFYALLNKQKIISTSTEGLGITLGNPNASSTIIKVCHPYCGPCAKAHLILEEILEKNDDVKVQIIFFMSAINDEHTKVVRHMLTLNEMQDAALIKRALDDWYTSTEKSYTDFSKNYLLDIELPMQTKQIELMSTWCKEVDIKFTPTLFINGHQLPEIYRFDELPHLL